MNKEHQPINNYIKHIKRNLDCIGYIVFSQIQLITQTMNYFPAFIM